MKSVHRSIWPIIMIFVLLIASLILLHKDKKRHLDQLVEQSTLSNDNLLSVYEQIKGVACSKDFKLFADIVHRLEYAHAVNLIKYLMRDEHISLSYNEKVEAALMTALLYEKSDEQYAIFNCMCPEKCTDSFLILVASAVDHLLPQVIGWLQHSHDVKTVQLFCKQAYERAVAINSPHLCNLLMQYQIKISKEVASQLLWQVVANDKHQQFIPLLLSAGANVHMSYLGKTLLMYALERGNKKIVHALVAVGADEVLLYSNEQQNRIVQAARRLKELILKKWHTT